MPTFQNIVFKCKECGYKELRQIGDVRPDKNELKPCPKCGGMMEATKENPDIGTIIIDSIKHIFGR